MNDYFISMGISVLLEFLKSSVKNPTQKRKWRNAMVKVAHAILAAYPDDPELKDYGKK